MYCSGTYVDVSSSTLQASAIWRLVDTSIAPGTANTQPKGLIMSWPLVFDLHVNTFASIAEIIDRACNATFKEGEEDAYYLQVWWWLRLTTFFAASLSRSLCICIDGLLYAVCVCVCVCVLFNR